MIILFIIFLIFIYLFYKKTIEFYDNICTHLPSGYTLHNNKCYLRCNDDCSICKSKIPSYYCK